MTRPRSDRADSMDALAERCFQLDANRLKEQQIRAHGEDTRVSDAIGLFRVAKHREKTLGDSSEWGLFLTAASLISLVVIAIGVGFWVAFGLGFVAIAIWIYGIYWVRKIRSASGRPGATAAGAFVRLWKIQASVKQGVAAYARGEPWAVARVHEYAVEEFRNRVAKHREKTLGDSSEWGRARASLMQAASEAQRSAAYWRARLRQEPSNEFAKSQKDVSDRLQAKLDTAFEKLEARSVALRRFYNECDARLAAMDHRNRDLEEFRRLEELSGRADMIIAHAEGIIESFAIAFAAEARAFADTLRGVATVSIKALAGEAPMDNIDYFADRIIEDSDRDRAAIEDLERRLAP